MLKSKSMQNSKSYTAENTELDGRYDSIDYSASANMRKKAN